MDSKDKEEKENYSKKDVDEIKFKPRDDDDATSGTPKSPLPGGIIHKKKQEEEVSKLM